MKQPSRLRRWLDRRTLITLVAAVSAVATVVYAVNTVATRRETVRSVADAQADSALSFPCDIPGLLQKAAQFAADPGGVATDPGAVVQQVKALLASCGIDTSPAEQFLQQIEEAPQQLTADAEQLLVQQEGVTPADFNELQAEIQTVMEDPTQIGQLGGSLLAKIGKYGRLVTAAIVVVVVALLIFGAGGQSGKNRPDWENGPGCGADAATLDGYLAKLPVRPVPKGKTEAEGPTTGTAFDTPNNPTVVLTVQSGSYQTPDEKATGWNLAAEAVKIVPGQGNLLHVETKIATYMRLQGDRLASQGQASNVDKMCLVINHDGGPCDLNAPSPLATGCLANVPRLMSRQRGQSLTVNWKLAANWYHIDIHN